ncbi:Taurine import ATP-binding protein TauB [Anoxybacillus sp. BCO1]|nr:Taurine import ATP-binding protein TauB [Anoxybacillus sp. BCO1]
MPILTIDQVMHAYVTNQSAVLALDHLSLTVERGEFLSFLGPSGCGKTTLLSIIAGLIEPTKGRVLIEGKEAKSMRQTIGYMLQHDYLFPWKTIEQNVTLGLKLTGKYSEKTRKQTLALLHQIGLRDVDDRYPYELSGGMRQRAALVRTLATDPKILLLDEPFSALDYQTKLKLEDLVWETLKQYRKTVLLVTHDIGEAIAMSDRIVLFTARPGKIKRNCFRPRFIKSVYTVPSSPTSRFFTDFSNDLEGVREH